MTKHFPLAVSLILVCTVFAGEVMARPAYLSQWQTRYNLSDSDTANCQLCHQNINGGNGWNAYGWAVRSTFLTNGSDIDAAFVSVEDQDSDADPTASSNLIEINASSQPGWTDGPVNTIFFRDDTTLVNQLPPDLATLLDPAVNLEPDISVTPGSIDFGLVAIGLQGSQDVVIENVGQADLLITGINLCTGTSTEISWSGPANTTIPSATGETLTLAYAPLDEGVDSGCIELNSNDPDQPTVAIAVSGEGFTAQAELLDIDIDQFNVTADTQVGGAPVNISLDVRNNSAVGGNAEATVVGSQNNAQVYSETINLVAMLGSNTQTLSFPDYMPVDTGDINWLASVNDEDPDLDETTASTSVSSSLAISDPIPATIRKGSIKINLETVASGLVAPNYAISAPGLPNYLFVVDQPGILWKINLTTGSREVFLDVSAQLVPLGIFGDNTFDERGLLGVAFHPDYAQNGLLYTYTSEPVTGAADFSTMPVGRLADHQSVIAEWRVTEPGNPMSVVDTASKRVLLRIDQPQFNHDGGTVAFGPDGLLYIALGDGGGADDVDGQESLGGPMVGHGTIGNGQDASNPLGTILRIDPAGNNAANGKYGVPADNPFTDAVDSRLDEIYAYGFRNPYRFSFDTRNGDLYAADVGQNDIEEVDLVFKGGNYGWNLKEGSFFFDANGNNDGFVTSAIPDDLPADLIDPILEYDHDEGLSVIGGFVYRGNAIKPLVGRYVFADWSSDFSVPTGRLFYRLGKRGIREFVLTDRQNLGLFVQGFGQDAAGELYVLANATGTPFGDSGVVMRIVPAAKGRAR